MSFISLVLVATCAMQTYSSSPAQCDLLVVGAGAGGVYAAWRVATAGNQGNTSIRSVCIYERAHRPGGRIHSLRNQGPFKDLVVEVGAYRFAPTMVISPGGGKITTPITAATISALNLSTAPYNPNPNDWDHGFHKIVDAEGHDAGYLTVVEAMLEHAVSNGAHVQFGAEVVSLDRDTDGRVLVKLADDTVVRASVVLLNIPQLPLLQMLRHSSLSWRSPVPMPLYLPEAYPLVKMYVHYDDAWWRSHLGLTHGGYEFHGHNAGDAGHLPPLNGMYHDGDVRCDSNGNCRGFLQVVYYGTPDVVGYYAPFMDQVVSDSALQLSPENPEQRQLLVLVHEGLVERHRAALDAINATARVAEMLPSGGVLAIWSQGVPGIGAGCHYRPENLFKIAAQPFPGQPLYVANEAFGPGGCFAECSLNMSESFVQQLGIPKPSRFQAGSAPLGRENRRDPTDPVRLPQSLMPTRAPPGRPPHAVYM